MKKSRKKRTTHPKIPESMAALAGGMADDFNNILTTVMGACSLIDRDDPGNGELLQCVALIRASAEHAAALSDQLARAGMQEKVNGDTGGCPHDSDSASASVRDKKDNNSIE